MMAVMCHHGRDKATRSTRHGGHFDHLDMICFMYFSVGLRIHRSFCGQDGMYLRRNLELVVENVVPYSSISVQLTTISFNSMRKFRAKILHLICVEIILRSAHRNSHFGITSYMAGTIHL